jgi:hypothetical protein
MEQDDDRSIAPAPAVGAAGEMGHEPAQLFAFHEISIPPDSSCRTVAIAPTPI